MSSQWQRVEVPFRGGLDEKGKPEALPNGAFTRLVNVVQTRDGAYGKRNGFSLLAKSIITSGLGGSIAAGSRLFSFRDAVCAIDGHWLYTYSETAAVWQSASLVPECVASRMQCLGLSATPDYFDVVYCNGYYVMVACSGGTIVTVLDAATGARARADMTLLSGGGVTKTLTRCVAIGTTVFLLYWDDVLGATLKYSKLDCSSAAGLATGCTALATLPNCTDLIVNATGFSVYDVVAGSSLFYVAYVNNSGGASSITVRSYNTTPTQQTTTTVNSGSGNRAVGIGGDQTDRIWIAWDLNGAGNVMAIGLDPTSLAITSTSAIVLASDSGFVNKVSVLGKGSGAGHVMACDELGVAGSTYWRNFTTVAGAVSVASSTRRKTFRQIPISRQILVGGRIYAMWMQADNGGLFSQNTTTIVDITDASTDPVSPSTLVPMARPVANLASGLTDAYTYARTPGVTPCHWASVSATKVAIPQMVRKSDGGVLNGGVSSLDIFPLDFAATNRWQVAPLGEGVSMSGGTPTYFDGQRVAEIGFVVYPEITATLAVAGVGYLTAGSVYTYYAVYEHVDAVGATHWSAPSLPVVGSPTAGNTIVNVTVTNPQVSARLDGTMRVALYRKLSTGVATRVATSVVSTLTNTTLFSDTLTDVEAATKPVLYTEGGALARLKPPSLSVLIAHGDRLAGVDDTGKSVWFSGQYVYGEALWWTALFQFPVDAGGPITALGSMDGRLYVFKRDTIFFVDGDGPPDAGGPGYALPREIPSGIGCIEPRSVVRTPAGLLFQSDQGIYLLTRSLELRFIGRGVEQSTLTYGTISSAVLDEVHGRVYFTMGATAVRLVYDYVHEVWTTDSISTAVSTPAVLQDAVMVGGTLTSGVPKMHLLCTNGQVLRETPGTYLDGAAWITATLETGWFKLDGVQGYNRVRETGILAEYLTGHELAVSVGYDYATSYTDAVSWTAAQIAAFTTTREQVSVSHSRQKTEAVRVLLVDATPSSGSVGTGQGAAFIGLVFSAAPKGGTYRLPAAQTK
jgi:hypothetical protein